MRVYACMCVCLKLAKHPVHSVYVRSHARVCEYTTNFANAHEATRSYIGKVLIVHTEMYIKQTK